MKRKPARKTHRSKKLSRSFAGPELLLLAAVTLALLVFFAWQTGTLPGFLLR